MPPDLFPGKDATSCAERAATSSFFAEIGAANLWAGALGSADTIRCLESRDFGPAVLVTVRRSGASAEVTSLRFAGTKLERARYGVIPIETWRTTMQKALRVVSNRQRVQERSFADPHMGVSILLEVVRDHTYSNRAGKLPEEETSGRDLQDFCAELLDLAR